MKEIIGYRIKDTQGDYACGKRSGCCAASRSDAYLFPTKKEAQKTLAGFIEELLVHGPRIVRVVRKRRAA